MNAEEMWHLSGIQGRYDVWGFGTDSDILTGLVLTGEKTATCSLLITYELKGQPLPQPGEYSIILDSKNEAVCVILTKKVYTLPFSRVTAFQAAKEGEGDKSLSHWRDVHREFFTKRLKLFGLEFDENMEVLFEEFEKVFPV